MKQKLLLSTALVISFFSQAQVPNGTFETLNTENRISQWAKNYLMSVVIDTTGEVTGDSIVFDNPDNQLYRATTDAHSGVYALEMTNGFNYTTNSGYVGGAFLASSDFYSAIFPEMVYVDPIQPETFSFYYKYFPQATDSAIAVLTLFDSDLNQIGQTSVVLGGTVSDYTLVSLPIQYDVLAPVNAMSITFATATPSNQPTPGTRFIVDDVELSGNLSVEESEMEFAMFPNPANSAFLINSGSEAEISIFTASGTEMEVSFTPEGKVDCSAWANGCYLVKLTNDDKTSTRRIVVSH